MPQHHDIGHQKRLARLREITAEKEGIITPESLARSLVKRGLASPTILNAHHKPADR